MENKDASNSSKPPRVFISYSWTTEDHQEWVLELAKRLVNDGVDIILDKWFLKDGHDTLYFMEQMAKSDVEKVLVICDEGYQKKSANRKGGVGTEAQIISPDIYQKVKQEKFIPIVSERNENGEHFLPVFMKSLKYIDLSTHENYEGNYESLLRTIYNKPALTRPKLGNPPKYLTEDGENFFFKTTGLNRQVENSIKNKPSILPILIEEFKEEFLVELENFRLVYKHSNDEPFDEIVFQSINQMLPLRNDFIKFVELCSLIPDFFPIDTFIELFEKIIYFLRPTYENGRTGYNENQFDNFKFFIYEIFLYFVTVLLKQKKYSILNEFLNNTFFIKDKFSNELHDRRYNIFQNYIRTIDEHRNSRLNLQYYRLTGELLINRTTNKYNRHDLASTDLLLLYLGQILYEVRWTSILYFYISGPIDLLQRLKSKRFFEGVKTYFNVQTPEQLKASFAKFKNPDTQYRGYDTVPDLEDFIEIEKICSIN